MLPPVPTLVPKQSLSNVVPEVEEPSENGPVDEPLDVNNLEAAAGANEYNPVILAGQNNEVGDDQQVLGYLQLQDESQPIDNNTLLLGGELELQKMSLENQEHENATIYVEGGLNFQNGERLVVTQNGEANEIILLFANGNSGTLVVQNTSGFCQENVVYIEDAPSETVSQTCDNLLSPANAVSANAESIDSVNTESVDLPAQPESNTSEMLFIPTPTVVGSYLFDGGEQKFMQFAELAADQKADGENEDQSCPDSLYSEVETSVTITQKQEQESDVTVPDTEGKECEENNTVENNTVSVIQTTTFELQDSLENQISHNISSDVSSVENFRSSDNESELPSDLMDSNDSRMFIQNDIERTEIKETEKDCLSKDSKSQLEDAVLAQGTNSDIAEHFVSSNSGENSPVSHLEDYKKLDDPLSTEKMSIDRVNDMSSPNICNVEKDDIGDIFRATNKEISEKRDDVFKAPEIPVRNQKAHIKKITVPATAGNEYEFTDNDAISTVELGVGLSKKNAPIFSVFKSKGRTLFSTTIPGSCRETNKTSQTYSQCSVTESKITHLQTSISAEEKNKTYKSQKCNSAEISVTDHVSVNRPGDAKTNMNSAERLSAKNNSPLNTASKVSAKSQSAYRVTEVSMPHVVNEILTLNKSTHALIIEKKHAASNLCDSLLSSHECSSLVDSTENVETCVKPPKKTYINIRKKFNKPNIVESAHDNIELFSGDVLNFSECDKEIQEAEHSLNPEKLQEESGDTQQKNAEKESPQENTGSSETNKIIPSPFSENSYENSSTLEKNIEAELSENHLTENAVMSSSENNNESDDSLPCSVQIQASLKYDRKKKIVPPKKEIKSHSLRLRTSTPKAADENRPQEETTDIDVQKILDLSSSENWGDVLMNTSFETPSTVTDDTPSASQTPLQQPLPTSSASELLRRRSNKLKRDFDRLLTSTNKSKRQKNYSKKVILGIKRRNRKRKYDHRFESLGADDTDVEVSLPPPKQPKSRYRGVKKASIHYLNASGRHSTSTPQKAEEPNYACSNCSFSSSVVNNLIMHLKFCPNRNPPITYTDEDLNNRERIRGEGFDTSITSVSELIKMSLAQDLDKDLDIDLQQPGPSGMQSAMDMEEDESDMSKRSKFGYGEGDVVWAKVKDRFWPGLVSKLVKNHVYIKLLYHPEMRGFKTSEHRVYNFDDAKWNKMLLAEAKSCPHFDTFVKALEKAERYVYKRCLGLGLDPKTHFSLPDDVSYTTDSESSDDNINEEDDNMNEEDEDDALGNFACSTLPPSKKARYEKLNIKRIKDYILAGHLNGYVLRIYHRFINSSKHRKFFSGHLVDKERLYSSNWFGPMQNQYEGALVNYFNNIFISFIGDKFFVPKYVPQVWIPEAIIKAICIFEGVPRYQAVTLYDSDDSENEDSDSGALDGSLLQNLFS